jgi:hypothetical protein
MSDADNKNYNQIGFDSLMQRSDSLVFVLGSGVVDTLANQTSNSGGAGTTASTTAVVDNDSGSTEEMSVKSDGAIGDIWIKNFIRSVNWQPKTVGFYIDGQTGYAEFMNVYISGNIDAATGNIGGWSIGATTISSTGVVLSSSGDAYISFGTTPPTSPTVGTGIFINKTGLFGLASNVQKFKIDASSGTITATGAVIDGTSTLGGRTGSILAAAIDSVGHFVDNALNTSTKNILLGFTFGSADYSGSFKTGNITWNTSTGAITGGSGIVINKAGIVGANGGTVTFSIDGTTGSATFSGTLSSGISITSPVITGGTITGSNLQTSASTSDNRIIVSGTNNDIEFWNEDNDLSGTLSTFYTSTPSPTSGVSLEDVHGNYCFISGRSSMGFAELGTAYGSLSVVWDENDPATSRIEINVPVNIDGKLNIHGDITPTANSSYYLGNTSYKWEGYFDFIHVDFVGSEGLHPAVSASYNLGNSSYKWANIWAVTTHFGDAYFANDFRMSEEGDDGINFYNKANEKLMILYKNGDLKIKGKLIQG